VKTLVLIVAFAVLLIAGCGEATQTETGGQPDSGAAAETPKATQKAEPKWRTVAKLKGSGDKRGQTFKLHGDEAKLNYSVKGDVSPIFAVYIMAEGTSLQDEGGLPEAMVTENEKDTTFLVKDAGRYYIEVMSANCNWTVTVREKR